MMQKKSKDWKLANPKCNHWRLITGCKLEERKGGSNSEHACRWAGHGDEGDGREERGKRGLKYNPSQSMEPGHIEHRKPSL